jgi:putative DNA primase/helicase
MNSVILKDRFLEALRRDGIEPDCEIIPDGRLHRFRDWLDKPGTLNGWYILFPDYPPTGIYGCWRRGIRQKWTGSLPLNHPLITNRLNFLNKIVKKQNRFGRLHAEEILSEAAPANGRHGYLMKKHVDAHGISYLRGALLIPLRDMDGQIHGLQRIFPDGSKFFSKGTNKTSHFHLIGNLTGPTIYIAEGYATAATVHELSGVPTAVAFDAGNLLPVAEALRKAHPDIQLIICADYDRWTIGNPGMTFALKAADAVGGRIVWPRFSDFNSRGSDFNDLSHEEGEDAVLKCLNRAGGEYV